jgi:hypothetical protein
MESVPSGTGVVGLNHDLTIPFRSSALTLSFSWAYGRSCRRRSNRLKWEHSPVRRSSCLNGPEPTGAKKKIRATIGTIASVDAPSRAWITPMTKMAMLAAAMNGSANRQEKSPMDRPNGWRWSVRAANTGEDVTVEGGDNAGSRLVASLTRVESDGLRTFVTQRVFACGSRTRAS